MPTSTLSVADFEVVRESYTSNPWRIVHRPTGQYVSIPQQVQNGNGQTIPFRGQACFPRKRDALAWMRDELPALVDSFNAKVAA